MPDPKILTYPPVLYQDATATLKIFGLAASCLNSAYDDSTTYPNSVRKTRWEVALPRFRADHALTIRVRKDGPTINLIPGVTSISGGSRVYNNNGNEQTVDDWVIGIDPSVKYIEIRSEGNGATGYNPTNADSNWSRTDPKDYIYDYQWVTDFENVIAPIPGLAMTLLYVYDATFYSYLEDTPSQMLHVSQDDSGPVLGGQIQFRPDYVVGPILDNAPLWGYTGSAICGDFHPSDGQNAGTGKVDVFLKMDDKQPAELLTTLYNGSVADQGYIEIDNVEIDGYQRPAGADITTASYGYSVGDNYLYYQIFNVDTLFRPFHDWEKIALPADKPNIRQSYITDKGEIVDCDGVSVKLANLDGFKQQ